MQTAIKHFQKCSTDLTVREMHINTTLTFYLWPVEVTIIKKWDDHQFWHECREKGNYRAR